MAKLARDGTVDGLQTRRLLGLYGHAAGQNKIAGNVGQGKPPWAVWE